MTKRTSTILSKRHKPRPRQTMLKIEGVNAANLHELENKFRQQVKSMLGLDTAHPTIH